MAAPDLPGPQTSLASATKPHIAPSGLMAPGTLVLERHAHSQVCSSALAWGYGEGTLKPAPWGSLECCWDNELDPEQPVKRLRTETQAA